LPHAKDTPFNSSKKQYNHRCLHDLRVTDPREDRARIKDAKDTLLKDCYAWILDDGSFQRWRMQGDSKLLWIKGDPGKGKTMMMMGLIDELSQGDRARPLSKKVSKMTNMLAKMKLSSKPALVAYFFCQSDRPELNNAVSVLRGLIYLLVEQREQLMQHVQKQYEILGGKMFEGLYALREILSNILNDRSLPPIYLLVDALDECTSDLSALLRIITDDGLAQRSRVKWLVTSRNVPAIEKYLQPDSAGVKVSLEISANHVSKAVASFVDFKVKRLAATQKYDRSIRAEVQQQLYDKAEGTFLWVSLVCKELESVPLYRTQKMLQAMPPGLDRLYDRMMTQILAQNDVKTVEYCKGILRSLTIAFRPLQLEELVVIADLPSDQFDNIQRVTDLVGYCGSFLTVRQNIVSFIHLSAKDYFTSGKGQQVFDGAVVEEQGRVTYCLLDAMSSTLRRDKCGVQNPGAQTHETAEQAKNIILPRIAYAACYWVSHLSGYLVDPTDAQLNTTILSDGGIVHKFLQAHLLHWLEALSWIGKTSEGIIGITSLETQIPVSLHILP
jgi:hypothetical protein